MIPPVHSDKSNEKKDYYQHYSRENMHELAGDNPPAVGSQGSNPMSEKDSVRPASEHGALRPVSELSSDRTDHARSPANNAVPTSPTSLPDVKEDEEMASTSQPGLLNRIRTARASKKHPWFSSA